MEKMDIKVAYCLASSGLPGISTFAGYAMER